MEEHERGPLVGGLPVGGLHDEQAQVAALDFLVDPGFAQEGGVGFGIGGGSPHGEEQQGKQSDGNRFHLGLGLLAG